jgi:cell division protein FtsB
MEFYRVKIIPLMLVVLLIFLQYRLWLQPGGMLSMIHKRKQLAMEVHQNDMLRKRNEGLLHEVQGLQQNKEAIESRARHELGMVKKGETFYQVVK